MNYKDEQTEQQSKQEEQSVSILKQLSQMDKKTKKIIGRAGIVAASLALSAIMIVSSNKMENMPVESVNSYAVVQSGDENVSGTDGHVKFDAFFLQNNDGATQGVRGINTEIGKQSTLYMELKVLEEGYFKDGVITINGKNFYLATSIEQDSEIKNDYIGNNVREIELNQINNGTQREITGLVRSGDYSSPETIKSAIGENGNNYSRSDNTIILTGIYVNGANEEIIIRKEVPLTVEWYEEEKEATRNVKGNISLVKGTPGQTLDLTVTKVWLDNNDSLGIRPSSVTVNLTAIATNQDSSTEPVTLDNSIPTQVTLRSTSGNNNGDNWTYTWEDLPINTALDQPITYSVSEEAFTGNLAVVYSSNVTEDLNNENTYIITNTYIAPTEKIHYQVN